MKTHLLSHDKIAKCGAIMTQLKLHTKEIKNVTCLVCIDKHKFDIGELKEWRLGGLTDNNKEKLNHINKVSS